MNIEQLAKVRTNVLIVGESGTGKSRIAQRIHALSTRKYLPFIELNIAAINDDLISSELYGHVRGSFTGAVSNSIGHCEAVQGGTLFLDEIGELSLQGQVKLLHLLENKSFYPLGSRILKKFNGVVILATNKNLKKMVEAGTFREDLYYRINGFQKEMTPLREKIDIGEEILKMFEITKREYQEPGKYLSGEVYNFMSAYLWPGNYRELKNVLEYCFVNSKKDEISLKDLPKSLITGGVSNFNLVERDYKVAMHQFEKAFLQCKLKENKGKINMTAKNIGISKVTLISKVKKYRIAR